MKVLNEFEFDGPLDKIIGICSDGAYTMQGRIKGVCTQLANRIRDKIDHGRPIDSFHERKGIFP
jgi:hypothetical protein